MKESQSLRGRAFFVGLGEKGDGSGRKGTGLCLPAVGEEKEKQAGVRPSGLGGAGVRGRGYPVVGRPFLSVCRREVRGTDGGWDTPFSLPVGVWGKRMLF